MSPLERFLLAAAVSTVATVGVAVPALAAPPPRMPHVAGKSLSAAYELFDYHQRISTEDGTGQGRYVFWPPNWKVCDQDPRAGVPLTGQAVVLTVVKRQEDC
ncbi:hypothetical protein Acsp05_28890 [Actinokineospora sp. NBRC 105648]|nr:hypothetical protein Acsp05_28890 [Actinokineospora sp. NBRC 105648]